MTVYVKSVVAIFWCQRANLDYRENKKRARIYKHMIRLKIDKSPFAAATANMSKPAVNSMLARGDVFNER